MLFNYTYSKHKADLLHYYVSKFIRNIYFKSPNRFSYSLFEPDFQKYLKRSNILKSLFQKFFGDFKKLSKGEKDLFYLAFVRTNDIKAQCNDHNKVYTIDDLPKQIQKATDDLFRYMYENTLNSVGEIKDHYEKFYLNLKIKVCPFCGIETLHYYAFYKQDYDHSLYKDKYPIASINMKNLVPMGRDCNTIFKKTKDVLHDGTGTRRYYIYPFINSIKIKICLTGSVYTFSNLDTADWRVSYLPVIEKTETWNDVFNICYRYKYEVFQLDAASWLNSFLSYLKSNPYIIKIQNKSDVEQFLKSEVNKYDPYDYQDRNFLRHAFFEEIFNSADDSFYNGLLNYLKT